MCGFLVSWLHPPLLQHPPTQIPLYLTYLLTFDPVLHLSLCFTRRRKYPTILPMFLYCFSPPHTIYSSHPSAWLTASPPLVSRGLVLVLFWPVSTEWIVPSCLACDPEPYEECRGGPLSPRVTPDALQHSRGSSGLPPRNLGSGLGLVGVLYALISLMRP